MRAFFFLLIMASSSYAQQKDKDTVIERKQKIEGKITDNTGPIPGATIIIKNTHLATVSDVDGNYSILVNENDLLIFTFIGCKSQTIPVWHMNTINVKFTEDHNLTGSETIIVKKPVIYLYPEKKTDVSIQLDFKGKLLTTFPKYDSGWNVTAYPDGKIFDIKTNRYYSSLFWDGEQSFPESHFEYKDGFVVDKDKLTDFLIEKLENIGLNTSETNDFMQYWLPLLEKNQTNFIHFWINDNYNGTCKNNVSPKPETTIRIFMEYYGLDNPVQIPQQQLKPTKRKGFTLVEWGGTEVKSFRKKNL